MTALLSAVAVGLASAAAGPPAEVQGEMEIAFGYVMNADGEKVLVEGLRVPFRAKRISAATADTPSRAGSGTDGGGGPPRIYQNVADDPFDPHNFWTGLGSPMPSALDDITLAPAGQGVSWEWLTIGMHTEFPNDFLIRWVIFDTFVPGRGPGKSAFDDVLGDFGGRFNFSELGLPVPGDYQITFDISVIGLTVADGGCYFAQQFREWRPPYSGEEPFLPSIWTLFNGEGVDIGSSEDFFWYDTSPYDGIYDETEIDTFNSPPFDLANFLLEVYAGDPPEIIPPFNFDVVRGLVLGGDLLALWFSDDVRLVVRPWFVLTTTESPVQVIVEAGVPTSSLSSLKFLLEASGSIPNLRQRIELFNYTTGLWVLMDEREATITDSEVEVIAQGNLSDYVEPGTNRVKARVSWKEAGPILSYPWRARIDRTVWKITRA
ncbi:MAG: hypothetical protein IH851_12270 [Armatimonadetes bacterium]|nr:hypothetical protein [Armatimonadota bacterium]